MYTVKCVKGAVLICIVHLFNYFVTVLLLCVCSSVGKV